MRKRFTVILYVDTDLHICSFMVNFDFIVFLLGILYYNCVNER